MYLFTSTRAQKAHSRAVIFKAYIVEHACISKASGFVMTNLMNCSPSQPRQEDGECPQKQPLGLLLEHVLRKHRCGLAAGKGKEGRVPRAVGTRDAGLAPIVAKPTATLQDNPGEDRRSTQQRPVSRTHIRQVSCSGHQGEVSSLPVSS